MNDSINLENQSCTINVMLYYIKRCEQMENLQKFKDASGTYYVQGWENKAKPYCIRMYSYC